MSRSAAMIKRAILGVIGSFTIHEEHFNGKDMAVVDVEDCANRLEDMKEMLATVRFDTNCLLELLKEEELHEEYITQCRTFEKRYFALSGKLRQAIAEKKRKPEQDGERQRMQAIKMPTRKLPTFDGRAENWPRFRDVFESSVHNNAGLNDVDKFQYLETALEIAGPANVLKSWKFCAENYLHAWAAVKARYEDRRMILSAHMKDLYDIKKMTNNSASELRRVIDAFRAILDALENLNYPLNNVADLAHLMIVHMVTERLDVEIVREWRKSTDTTDATWTEMFEFLEAFWKSVHDLEPTKKPKPAEPNKAKHAHAALNLKCYKCDGEHGLWDCADFLRLSIEDRNQSIRSMKLCWNCFGKHQVASCPSKSTCKVCSKRHHTLVHKDYLEANHNRGRSKSPKANLSIDSKPFYPNQMEQPSSSNGANASAHVAKAFMVRKREAMLSTAKVLVKGRRGEEFEGRVLVDGGSNVNFVTESFADRCQLKRMKTSLRVGGVGKSMMTINEAVHAKVMSRTGEYNEILLCYVVPVITDMLPANKIEMDVTEIPADCQLADDDFMNPGEIDFLLDNGVMSEILKDGKIKLTNGLNLINTSFGYLVGGYITSAVSSRTMLSRMSSVQRYAHVMNGSVDEQLEKFFEADNVEFPKALLTEEERYCEDLFLESTKRGPDGKFVVKLPLKDNVEALGVNLRNAFNCLFAQEARRKRDSVYDEMYVGYIKDLIEEGMMTEVQPVAGEFAHYLPHHGVLKMTSSSTKLRPVFNASSKSESGLSLNDVLCVGPTIQPESFDTLLRFREREFVIMGDITRMYLQVWVDEEHRKFLRILWRSNMSEEVRHYELNTVTFGTGPAPYLATRVLKQLADENRENFPEAARVLEFGFYVDDMIVSFDSVEEGIKVRDEVRQILGSAGLKLCKFTSNHPSLLVGLSDDLVYGSEPGQNLTKALGIGYCTQSDGLFYTIKASKPGKCTKSMVLSEIASLYDPKGFLAPVLTTAKLFMKRLWLMEVGWKHRVPDDFQVEWDEFRFELIKLNSLRVPRHLYLPHSVRRELHGFADASIKAYGLVVYALSYDESENVQVSIVAAKSRVAPKNQKTLARLELCAATLLAKMMHRLTMNLEAKFDSICCWSDSTIVLHWMAMEPARLQTFVGNRVAVIQELTKSFVWKHIRGVDNPADLVSRGLNPQELRICRLWWEGPPFFQFPQSDWPESIVTLNEDAPEVLEEVKKSFHTVASNDLFGFIETKFSNHEKLVRVFSIIVREVHYMKLKARTSGKTKQIGVFEATERFSAEVAIVRIIQDAGFSAEKQALVKLKELQGSNDRPKIDALCRIVSRSSIGSLSPFLDDNDVIRVGGRTEQSKSLKATQKHQVLLPQSNFTNRLLVYLHEKFVHAGQLTLMGIFKERYWLVRAKSAIKKVVNGCVVCFKANPSSIQQYMASLPESRVTIASPFHSVAVDYAGYFTMKSGVTRNAPSTKVYIAVFKCMRTLAMHLELVTDLSSKAFIAALDRFVSRRGLCAEIYSDNGTCFEGADNELKQIVAEHQRASHEWSTVQRIVWKFTTPAAPHAGGIYESGVKSMKHHLKRVLGSTLLTYEQFSTVLCKVESVLNSKPLTPISDDPNDFRVLTPGHFLIGRPLVALPERCMDDINMNRLSRWEGLQKIQQDFWNLWSREYLNQLQQRPKGRRQVFEFRIDDIVLLKDRNMPPMKWVMGRIVRLFPSPRDGVVRNVEVRTEKGLKQRHVDYLCLFPFNRFEAGERVASPNASNAE